MARKIEQKLSPLGVKAAKPGVHVDGGGLMLVVKPGGAATWMFRYMIRGRRRDMGLGPAHRGGENDRAMKLADARDRAAELRKLVKGGIDPLEKRKADEAAAEAEAKAAAEAAAQDAMTFRVVVDEYLAAHEKGWRNAKHRAQWAMTLREYAGPHLGNLPVAAIQTEHVEAALRPIWHVKPETASRLRGRIEAVLDYAIVKRWRSEPNPARWRGHLNKLFPARGKVKEPRHHAALPWQDMGAFMAALRARSGIAARALEFAVLTAARSGEVMGARWSEVDLDAAVWIVPAGRMKAGKEHRVPLSPAAVTLLRGLLPLRGNADHPDPLVFPGQSEGRPLSVMALTMLLRRMGKGSITAHGFRSAFRDWAGETTAHPREVIEHALAHRLRDKAEAAYARGDLFQKRRKLMEDWADFCDKAPAAVVPLHTAAAAG